MWLFKRKEIYNQIENYVRDKHRREYTKNVLWYMAKVVNKPCISLYAVEDLELFRQDLLKRYKANYYVFDALKEVRCFFRYYRGFAHIPPDDIKNDCIVAPLVLSTEYATVEAMKKHPGGRPPDIKGAEKVRKLRQKGLTYRKIGELVGKDVAQVYRWHKRTLPK